MSDYPELFGNTEQAYKIRSIVDEMSKTDGWQSLNEIIDASPKVLDQYIRFAEAALKALDQIEAIKRAAH